MFADDVAFAVKEEGITFVREKIVLPLNEKKKQATHTHSITRKTHTRNLHTKAFKIEKVTFKEGTTKTCWLEVRGQPLEAREIEKC